MSDSYNFWFTFAMDMSRESTSVLRVVSVGVVGEPRRTWSLETSAVFAFICIVGYVVEERELGAESFK
jgi:hypothetical protein